MIFEKKHWAQRAEWFGLFKISGGSFMFLMSLVGEARRMAPSLSRGISFVYVLRLRSGGLYIGCSTNLEKRFGEHERGKACRTTKLDPPKSVAWIEMQTDLPAARRRETQIKKWSRAKKEALIFQDTESLRCLAKSRD